MNRKRKANSAAAWAGAACVLSLLCLIESLPLAAQSGSSRDTTATAASAAKKSSTSKKRPGKKRATSTPSGAQSGKSKRGRLTTVGKKLRGQQKIDTERAQSIQEALIREHYLTGEPAGTWNQDSESAMRRYQADHGWQSKTVPDSRALISLGLGPSHDHLLNPESAMTTGPAVSSTVSAASSPQIAVSHRASPATKEIGNPAPEPALPPAPSPQ